MPPQNAQVKVAVIGAGAWGYHHARIAAAHPNIHFCAVVGRTPERTAARAALFGVPFYLDIADMLANEQPDLVTISLPNQGHFEATLQVIQSGTPLLVEKPLVFDLAQADRLLEEAAQRDLFFAINFNHRYARPVQMARAAIQAGRLGELIFAAWRFGGEGQSTHPHANLIETQCHGIDMLEWLCGPIITISAQMSNKSGKGYSTLVLALGFENGAVGSLVGSYDSSYAYPDTHRLEINGLHGRIVVEDTVRRYSFQPTGDETAQVWQAGYFNDADRDFHLTFDRHMDDLLTAFTAGAPPPIHARAGRRALAIAQAAIQSWETGHHVSVAPESA